MCVPVLQVHRRNEQLTHIGGSAPDGTPWGLTIDEAAALIDSKDWDFFVEVPAGTRVPVLAKTSSAGKRFLTTSRDGVAANNLEALPDLPSPLAGVLPPWPLIVPGTSLTSKTSIQDAHFRYKEPASLLNKNPPWKELHAGPFAKGQHDLPVPAQFWYGGSRWLRFTALVPYPATYEVDEVIVSAGAATVRSLERVPGDSPARRRTLEDQGKGWWTWDLVLTRPDGSFDPSKPSRLTEIAIVVRPGDIAWTVKDFVVSFQVRGVNLYCAPSVAVNLHLFSAAKVAPMPPPTCVVPDVVGMSVTNAFKALEPCHLNIYTIGGTTIDTPGSKVVAQSVTPGTTVAQHTNLTLRIAQTVAPGVREVRVTNSSSTQRSLDLWLFDYTTGGWITKGTVPYMKTLTVPLIHQHSMLLAATDFFKTGCDSTRPEEEDCVAWYHPTPWLGATNGPSASVTIL